MKLFHGCKYIINRPFCGTSQSLAVSMSPQVSGLMSQVSPPSLPSPHQSLPASGGSCARRRNGLPPTLPLPPLCQRDAFGEPIFLV